MGEIAGGIILALVIVWAGFFVVGVVGGVILQIAVGLFALGEEIFNAARTVLRRPPRRCGLPPRRP